MRGSQQTVENSPRDGEFSSCLLRNLYVGQEATIRTGHEEETGSKSGKEYCICHPAYLTYAEYSMRNTALDEAQAIIKIA